MKAAPSTIPAASVATISGLVQPRLLARIRAQTMPRAPPAARSSPAGSRLARDRSAAGILVRISGIMTSPIGTFSQKIHGQSRPWATAPPTTGPASTAIPVTLAEDPERPGPALRRERRGQQGERQREHQRRARALHGAGRDQRAGVRRQRARGRGRGEQADPGGQHPPPAQPLPQRRAGQQQHGEAQRVGVHRPLQGGQRRVQVQPDHRQGGRDDLRVQRHHQRRRRGQRQHPALPAGQARTVCTHVSSSWSVTGSDTGRGAS